MMCAKNMKKLFKKVSGFTLIELLVIVLIIGILAAIVGPLYQKAVFQSRMTEAFANLKTISDALKLCELEHGKIEGSFSRSDAPACYYASNLSISIGTVEDDLSSSFSTENFSYTIDRGSLTEEDTMVAAYNPKTDVCICIYEDGHFETDAEQAGCGGGTYPDFNVAEALDIEEGNCNCC